MACRRWNENAGLVLISCDSAAVILFFFKKISVTKTYVNLGLVCFQQSIGSQLWDAAFATQAVIASKLVDEYGSTLRRAHEFLKQSQVYSLVQKISYLLVHRSGIIAVIAVLT
jgi:hypothetical protein